MRNNKGLWNINIAVQKSYSPNKPGRVEKFEIVNMFFLFLPCIPYNTQGKQILRI